MAQHLPIPLALLECWDRNVARALEQDILRLSKDENEVTVVMPRRDFPKLRQRMLHDRTSRRISKALGRYPHVDVAIVPYYFAPRSPARTGHGRRLGRQVGSRPMRVIIMGCGRVGSELSLKLVEGGHDVTIIDKKPEAFIKYPPGDKATQMVGLGFDRDILEEAGIKEAEAFVAVSSGDNSNIVSARVALEHYHVPKVVARIYDPRRAEIYEKLNIPTVATTTWGIKQIQLMLFHDRQEVRESIGGGDLVRLRVPVPAHLVGKKVSDVNVDGKILVAGVSRGGGGFIPTADSTFQTGDYLAVIMAKDGMDLLDEVMIPPAGRAPLMRVVVTGAGAVGRHLASDLADRGHTVTLIEQDPAVVQKVQEWAPNVAVVLGDACEPWVLEEAELKHAEVVVAATGDDEDNLVTSLLAKQEFAVPRVLARVNHPKNEWLFTEQWGVDAAVSPPHILTAMVEEAVTVGDLVRLIRLEGGRISIVEMTLPDGSPSVGPPALRAAPAARLRRRRDPPRRPRGHPAARDGVRAARRGRRALFAGLRSGAPRRRRRRGRTRRHTQGRSQQHQRDLDPLHPAARDPGRRIMTAMDEGTATEPTIETESVESLTGRPAIESTLGTVWTHKQAVAEKRAPLRIYLGAAPGVGKTYAMLSEGQRRRERGSEVVIGVVETYDRPKTKAILEGLEVVPPTAIEYRGVTLQEMDAEAVIRRHPETALVDELAHTNVPGVRRAKRWEDVLDILADGIEVISTLNIQHIESLNDVVAKATGILQRETVPDWILELADQVELVDMSPHALRRRMMHGNVYPDARKAELALRRFFTEENLTALRELALMRMANQVDEELLSRWTKETRPGHARARARRRLTTRARRGPGPAWRARGAARARRPAGGARRRHRGASRARVARRDPRPDLEARRRVRGDQIGVRRRGRGRLRGAPARHADRRRRAVEAPMAGDPSRLVRQPADPEGVRDRHPRDRATQALTGGTGTTQRRDRVDLASLGG